MTIWFSWNFHVSCFLLLSDRLEQSAAHIRDLESRAKELEKMGASYPELLEQMREKLDQELNAYKNEIEENNRRNVGISARWRLNKFSMKILWKQGTHQRNEISGFDFIESFHVL